LRRKKTVLTKECDSLLTSLECEISCGRRDLGSLGSAEECVFRKKKYKAVVKELHSTDVWLLKGGGCGGVD